MPRSAGDLPLATGPARLEWSVQTTVLQRLCADRPQALQLMSLLALGITDRELLEELGFDKSRLDLELDLIADDYRQLSRAYFAHHALGARYDLSMRRGGPLAMLQGAAPVAFETVDRLGGMLFPGSPASPDRVLEEIASRSFLVLVEKVAGDPRPLLLDIDLLARSLPKSPASVDSNVASDGERETEL